MLKQYILHLQSTFGHFYVRFLAKMNLWSVSYRISFAEDYVIPLITCISGSVYCFF